MQRIMIIGGPGSGKSWLARQIGERLGLPVVAIDALVHDASGRQRSDEAIDDAATAATLEDRWIIEGGNSRTYAVRLARADWLIRLRPPRLARLLRVVRRGGATRELLAWTWSYDRVFGPRDDAMVAQADGRVVSDLRSGRAASALVAALPCPSGTPPSPISKGLNPV